MNNQPLTDMSDPSYDVWKLKADYAATRRNYTKAMRKEGDFNEDGELFKKSFDWEITKRLLTYLRP